MICVEIKRYKDFLVQEKEDTRIKRFRCTKDKKYICTH